MRRIVLLPPTDPDPAETARREVKLVAAWKPGVAGVAGWSEHGWEALRIAAEHPEVERLVLLATPIREGIDVPSSPQKPCSSPVPNGRAHRLESGELVEEANPARTRRDVPRQGHDLLGPRWPLVLRHLAPGPLR